MVGKEQRLEQHLKRLDDQKYIEDHYKKDLSASEIGERIGVARRTVIARANKHKKKKSGNGKWYA